MAYTTINKSSLHMNTKLYTGNGGTNAITGVGHQPDLTWIKDRDNVRNHVLTDAVRGVTKNIFSNTTGTESTDTSTLTAFNSDGFTLGNGTKVNGNSINFASWNWKANGAGSANTAGSINSTVSANTTAGFSICSWTGTGSNATIGHGLGAIPKFIIVKKLSGADSWTTYHASLGATKKINFDTGAAGTQSDRWNDTSPTDTLFSIGTNGSVNTSGATYIAYCFAEKKGYSKFGSYTGNGNVDGPFVYTGFKPAWVMTKPSSATGDWYMHDNKRDGYNPQNDYLKANATDAESNNDDRIDLLSNGFKIRITHSSQNSNGVTYIYMAFGQSIVGSNNVPATAR